jgi:hypothetical protein
MWVKIDDKFPRNPKILAAGLEASWWYLCALTHCAEQLTDGFIAATAVPVIAPHITDPQDVVERCAQAGLIQPVDGGWLIPDFLELNWSRQKVLAERESAAQRQRRRRAQHTTDTPEMSRRDTHRTHGDGSPSPSRSRPDDLSSSSTHGFNTRPVENRTTIDQVAQAVIDNRLARQHDIRNPNAWRRRALANLRTDDNGAWWTRLEQLIADYPGAPATMLAAAAEGETTPHLRHYCQKPA